MDERTRYDVGDAEAGIENGILKNNLGITDQKDLDDAETALFADTYIFFFDQLSQGKIAFDLSLLFGIHEYFLSILYDWAGKLRTVNISKDGVLFAPAKYLPEAMNGLGKILDQNFPTAQDTERQVADKLALIHDEINHVHPFREGNGRTLRLFIDLIVAHLDLPSVDWDKQGDYLEACRKGLAGNHSRMAEIILESISKK